MERRIFPIPILICVLTFALLLVIQSLSDSAAVNSAKFLSPPPEHLELFHFGFRESMADSLWLRWIQDNDTCQTYKGAAPSRPIAEIPNGGFANPRNRICDNSWSFKMLDAVSKLAPRFEMTYLVGGITLSVLVEDYD